MGLWPNVTGIAVSDSFVVCFEHSARWVLSMLVLGVVGSV